MKGRFKLVRNIGNYIISKYIPSFLIVTISFLSFWIPTNAYPARVGLVIGALLSLITQQYSSSLPVSYVYALSIWYMICITFVFMCLLQYSIAISEVSNKITFNSAKYVLGPVKDNRAANNGTEETRKRDTAANNCNGAPDNIIGECSYRKRDFFHIFCPNSR